MPATMLKDAQTQALTDIIGADLLTGLAGIFERMNWAEDEIEKAQRRHPSHADLIWHSFKVLCSAHELMGTEFVYRSHAAELLDRVAAGQDTRPGTAAEICCACHDASLLAPLTETAAGLYGRMWGVAFPDQANHWADSQGHYEALHASGIDDLEREARHKLTDAERRTSEIDCKGKHHGEDVTCTAAADLAAMRRRKPRQSAEVPALEPTEADGMLFALTGSAA